MSRLNLLLAVLSILTLIKYTSCLTEQQTTAVLLLGGEEPRFGTKGTKFDRSRKVELWGCPNIKFTDSILLKNVTWYPFKSSGIYREDKEDVLVCGGLGSCVTNPQHCKFSKECWSWDPRTDTWTEEPSLMHPSGNQMLVMYENMTLVLYGIIGNLLYNY
jgi:hypothetical protein